MKNIIEISSEEIKNIFKTLRGIILFFKEPFHRWRDGEYIDFKYHIDDIIKYNEELYRISGIEGHTLLVDPPIYEHFGLLVVKQ